MVHTDGMTNHQRPWGVQCSSASCIFGEVVLADIKPITVNKLDIRNKEQKTEGIWLGKTTNSGEHIIATMDASGKAFYTQSLTRLTPELQWDKKVFDKIVIQSSDSFLQILTMLIFNPQNIQNNQKTFYHHQDLNNHHQSTPTYVQHQKTMAKPDAYKPTHRLTSKQPPAIGGQLDNILVTKELSLENNEDKIEKKNMETIMKDIQVQPWWQYADDITMFAETAVNEAMNKEFSQLLTKKSFEEINKNSLTPEQLQQVVSSRWAITQRPTNNGTKDVFCGKGFSQFIHDTGIKTFAATLSSMAMRLLLTIAIIEQFAVFTIDVASAFLNTPIDEEIIVHRPKEYCHAQPNILWKMTRHSTVYAHHLNNGKDISAQFYRS
eukprot:6218539-Amphidinium_carterae.2